MARLDPDKLTVNYREGVTTSEPIIPRRYTLTHSDFTGELFLTIGEEFAFDEITEMRDEVFGEWVSDDDSYYLHAYVYVGNFGPALNAIRDEIFRRELPLALEATVYGDTPFFEAQPDLYDAPIWIQFDSEDPAYQSFENWGTPRDYQL
ncbi:staygreen family protein [Alkalihalophilus marmarensis]|uniref:staygreen family protein n=1 Tax=Alkalihalophilus marmarensis TaxID=521377 RepID=UPI002DB57A72|nr:staygreen family protein [Alkalihalophilus marmarensis]MEC2071004.1 staygreen family protein [Alkalihalophilus marmarensis]